MVMQGYKPTQKTHSPEDEQSILLETSRPNRLFSEPTLTLRDLHMVVPARLLCIYSFFFFSPHHAKLQTILTQKTHLM